jgi:hypothetical protein
MRAAASAFDMRAGKELDEPADQGLHLLLQVPSNDSWIDSRRLCRGMEENNDGAAKCSLDLGTQTTKAREQIELLASIGVEHVERALTSIVVTNGSRSGPSDRTTAEYLPKAWQPFISSRHASPPWHQGASWLAPRRAQPLRS